MSAQFRTAVFKLNGRRPQDIPIERLLKYMSLVAELVGTSQSVRISGITKGSVKFGFAVLPNHFPTFVERVATAKNTKRAPATVTKAVRGLEEMITEDGLTGDFLVGTTKLLHLHGYTRMAGPVVGPVLQRYTVRARIVGLEGKDATKHVRLIEHGSNRELRGDFRNDQLAVRLTEHLWKEVVEVSGMARLFRHPDGEWELRAFHIDDVRSIDPSQPSDVIEGLRAVFSDRALAREATAAVRKIRT
jgi:hypothetical protein